MRIVVMGGGVVGVTTAYQLQRDGHDVVVLERNGLPASGTSWGNAGMISPGHSFAWSSPKAPLIFLRSLTLPDQALRFRFSTDPRLYAWSLAFLAECTPRKARLNTLRQHALAAYSQSVLAQVAQEERLEFDRMQRGILYFYRSQRAFKRGVARMKLLEAAGQRIEVLDRSGVLALEPALSNPKADILGGVYCPTDETGDPAKFTRALAAIVAARGGEIRTGVTITGMETSGGAATRVVTDQGGFSGDAYVLALGSESPLLARTLGINLPIYPVKGYSLTIPLASHAGSPGLASIDEDNLIAISRFSDHIRTTATAEFAGYDTSHRPSDFRFMKRVVEELYPGGADYDRAEMWAGLRPMTPSNLPLFGRRSLRNLYLNCGHGHIGWTLSHGSARITADLIAGRPPALPLDGSLS